MAAATFALSHLLPAGGEDGDILGGGGWDSSILQDDDFDDGAPSRFSRRPTVSAHAVAAGGTVLGTRGGCSDGGSEVRHAASWSTPLSSEVVTLDATPSLVAAATRSEVSLLKASTGEVLATKAIASGGAGGGRAAFLPRVHFVREAARVGGSTDDAAEEGNGGPSGAAEATALAVLCPMGVSPGGPTNVILISNLDGPALDTPEGAAEALGRVEISSVPFPCISSPEGEEGFDTSERGPVTDVHAVRVGGLTVRLFARQGGSRAVSVMDYSLADRTCKLLLPDLGRHIESQGGVIHREDEPEGCAADVAGWEVGNGCLIVSETRSDGSTQHGRRSLAWIDALSLSVLARHDLPENSSIVSLASVSSCHEDCVAAAVVTRDEGVGGAKVQLVQSMTTQRGGRCDSRRSMVLFAIGLDRESEVCPSLSADDDGSYGFLCVSKSGGIADEEEIKSWTFRPNDQAVVGEVHRALVAFDYERAAELADRLPAVDDSVSTIDVPFHRSMIGLHQFKHLLSRDLASNAEEARECLRRLVSGAVADSRGVDSLVEASQYLVCWPGNLHSDRSEDAGGDALTRVTLQQVAAALSAMIQALENASQVISNSFKVDEQIAKLTEKRAALEALSSIAPSAQTKLVPMDDPHLNAESIVGLLHLLVRQGAFKSVEHIQREFRGKEGCQSITPQSLAALALRVPLRISPRSYLPWLCDTVLPALHIGHGLLDGIRGWSCRAADYHDSDGLGLESSIELLAVSASSLSSWSLWRSIISQYQLRTFQISPLPLAGREQGDGPPDRRNE